MLPFFLAYIDPNAGGWLFQLILPVALALAGFWGALRKRWKRLTTRADQPPKDAKPGDK